MKAFVHRWINFGLSLAAVLVLALFQQVQAQKIDVQNSRPVYTGARGLAFADALVADIYDVSSMYSNAAGLAFIQRSSILIDHSVERVIGSMNENVSVPLHLGTKETIAFGLSVHHVGYVGQSKNQQYKVIEYGYDVAYATEIFEALSLGGSLNVRYGKTTPSGLWAVSGALGILYFPSPNFSYGAALRGIGNGIIYSSDQISTSLSTYHLPLGLEVGLTLRNPTLFRITTFTISLSNEKTFNVSGLIYKGGVEFLIKNVFLARFGYSYQSETKVGSPRYGAGLQVNWLTCDYSIAPFEASDEWYRLTFGVKLR